MKKTIHQMIGPPLTPAHSLTGQPRKKEKRNCGTPQNLNKEGPHGSDRMCSPSLLTECACRPAEGAGQGGGAKGAKGQSVRSCAMRIAACAAGASKNWGHSNGPTA